MRMFPSSVSMLTRPFRLFKLKQSNAVLKSKRKLSPFSTNLTFNNKSSNRLSTDVLDSVDIVNNESNKLNANISKTFVTGSQLGISYGYSQTESNSRKTPVDLRSYYSSNLYVSLSQPLLAELSNIFRQREWRLAQFNKNSNISLVSCKKSKSFKSFLYKEV